MLHFEDGFEIKKHERLLLRPWLENLIDSGKIPGLEWFDSTRTLFRVPWKHQSRKTWSLGHSSVFLEWAKNTGRWREGDPEPHYAQLKTRLRCAFSKAPDIEEMKNMHCSKTDEPYKVYRFIPKRESKLYPFGWKLIARKSIHNSLKRGFTTTPEGSAANYDGEPQSCQKRIKGFEESPVIMSNELDTDHVKQNILSVDHVAGPLETTEIPRQKGLATTFNSQVPDHSPITITESSTYPVSNTIKNSHNESHICGMNFKATTEPFTDQDRHCRKPQTILPPIEEELCRLESKHSLMEEPNSMSVGISQNTQCTAVSTERELDNTFLILPDLPAMSVLEKVECWSINQLPSTPAVNSERVRVRSPNTDEWHQKLTEKLMNVGAQGSSFRDMASWNDKQSPLAVPLGQLVGKKVDGYCDSFSSHKDDNFVSFNLEEDVGHGFLSPGADKGCSSFNPGADGGHGPANAVNPQDKGAMFRKPGEQTGSNVAVATPIFPLKNRYNISRNYPDRERLSSSNECQYFNQSPTTNDCSFINVPTGKQFPLENGKDYSRQLANVRPAARQNFPAGQEKNRKLEWPNTFLQQVLDQSNRNLQVSQDEGNRPWLKTGQMKDRILQKTGERQNGNWQMCGSENGGRNSQTWAFSDRRKRHWPLHRLECNQAWQVPRDSHEEPSMLVTQRYNQNDQILDGFHDRNQNSYTSGHDRNWEHSGSLLDESQLVLTGGDPATNESHIWSVEDAGRSRDHRDVCYDTITKEGPLDLSNKTNCLICTTDSQVKSCQHDGLTYVKMLDSMCDHNKTLEEPRENCQRTEHPKTYSILEEQQGCHFRKLGDHTLSMDASFNHLKAAYKKLVLRTMSVAEKERELDVLEKRLMAREEAVCRKEEQVQKMLLAFADGRHPEKTFNSTKFLAPSWDVDDVGWRSYQENSAMQQSWPVAFESENSRKERTSAVEMSLGNYPPIKSLDITDAPLQSILSKNVDFCCENFSNLHNSSQIMENSRESLTSNQSFFKSVSRVLPSVDQNPVGRNMFTGRCSQEESADCQPSGICLPESAYPCLLNSGVPSQELPWKRSDRMKEIEEKEFAAKAKVASGRFVYEDTNLKNTWLSLTSNSVKSINGTCAPVGSFREEVCSFGLSEMDKGLMLRNSVNDPMKGKEITRILPPVSPGVVSHEMMKAHLGIQLTL